MIPWAGDIVKLNPQIDIKKYYSMGLLPILEELGQENREVINVYLPNEKLNRVIVDLSYGKSFGILVPDGRFCQDKEKPPATSLFCLVSGKDECRIQSGIPYPFPVPGDTVFLENHSFVNPGKYVLASCNCLGDKGWPNEEMKCGAHIVDSGGGICYNLSRNGWTCDGILYRPNSGINLNDPLNIRSENIKPESKLCCNCKSGLINPISWDNRFKHCPKCEP